MDKREAQDLLQEYLIDLKSRSYQEWKTVIGESTHVEKKGPSGTIYQIEFGVFWDSEVGGNMRVMVSIDDGSIIRSIIPLTIGFLISPEGEII